MDEVKEDSVVEETTVEATKPKRSRTKKTKELTNPEEQTGTSETKPKKKKAKSTKKKKSVSKSSEAKRDNAATAEIISIESELEPMGQAEVSEIPAEDIANDAVTPEWILSEEASPEAMLPIVTEETAVIDPITVQVNVEASQTVALPLIALKVRNVVGKVENLVAEIIPNKVIIQGTIHEQLFFVGNDGIVHHLADDIPFSAFVDVPGVKPGMNAHLCATIEDIITELSPDGQTIIKKFIIEVFVKVTETVQVNLVSGTGPVLFLRQVVGENTEQTLIEADVTLDTPALKIDEIAGSIRDLEVEVIKDKVIIQGTLHKQIFFVDTANLGRHQGEDLQFSLFVDIPGAMPGMDVQVHPNIEGIFFDLITPVLLRQKAVIEFFVKVTENILQPVTIGDGPLFQVEEFIGENQVQELSDTLVTLFRPALKVREILAQIRDLTTHVITDKLIVQGTIHKQIFFIGTDNIEYHQAEDVPFSLFLDIPGTGLGDLVHLNTRIEAVFFELLSATELRQKVIIAVHASITREVQLNLVVSTGPLVKIEQVVGENTTQILVVRREAIVAPLPSGPVVNRLTVFDPGELVLGSQQIILNNTLQLPTVALTTKEITAIVLNQLERVIADGVLVEGNLEKTVVFIDTDNVVRNITETVPFTILVGIPGISPEQIVQASVSVEDIVFNLNPTGTAVNQTIVLRADVRSETLSRTFVVVTDVSGTGIVQTKVLVRALVQTANGPVSEEFEVVTDVSGPGILNVTKQLVFLDVVGDDNPNRVPIEVVTDVIV